MKFQSSFNVRSQQVTWRNHWKIYKISWKPQFRQPVWNLVRMNVSKMSRSGSTMDHVGSKAISLGHVSEKPLEFYKCHILTSCSWNLARIVVSSSCVVCRPLCVPQHLVWEHLRDHILGPNFMSTLIKCRRCLHMDHVGLNTRSLEQILGKSLWILLGAIF